MNQIEWIIREIESIKKRVNILSTLESRDKYNIWIPIYQTASYVSATSVSISGIDLTAYLKNYIKCRFYQSGWKYGYIASSSLSSGNTIAVFVSNTSYSVANAAIDYFEISYSTPVDFPGWLSYTPTWTAYIGSPTIGNGSLTGSFSITNHIMVDHISAVFGSTTNFASSQIWYFGLPVQPALATMCAANGEQSGGTKWIFQARTDTGLPRIVAGMMNNSSGWVQYNTPFTWASGDKYTADIVCRI